MKCPECGGTGIYQGFNSTEMCIACRGTGSVKVPDVMPTDDELGVAAPRPMIPLIGERIFYTIDRMYGIITYVDDEERFFLARFKLNETYGKFEDLTWNVTLGIWETSILQAI